MRPTTVVDLHVEQATAALVASFGTLLDPGEDGTPFGAADAGLVLSGGTPRFYVMTLHARALQVDRLTRHAGVTQCLAALEGQDWIMVMAPPGPAPNVSALRALRLSGRQALAMHVGTWHAGPHLLQPTCHFVNLELSDTNVTDHETVPLQAVHRLVPRPIQPPPR